MRLNPLLPLAACLSLLTCTPARATAQDIPAALGVRWEQATASGAGAVAGVDGWFFLAAELRSYSRGRFWGADAAGAARAKQDQDPAAAITAFHRMVEAAGIELIVVPVPGKVAAHADRLDPALAGAGRWDAAHQAFNAELTAAGVRVIDLLPELLALRDRGIDPYCRQDSHWSPVAMRLAAERIAQLVKSQPWYAAVAKHPMQRSPPTPITAQGDLVQMLRLEDVAPEPLTIEPVAGAAPERTSPVVLMGDSHTLVFHDPALLAADAGLPEHLAAELGMAVDLVGVRGSGANASRIALARRKDNLAGKRCLVWVFAAREFTESIEGWKQIPVIR